MRTFEINGRALEARSRIDGQNVEVGVFDGKERIWLLAISVETIQDMQDAAAGSGTDVETLEQFAERDVQRLVRDGLLALG